MKYKFLPIIRFFAFLSMVLFANKAFAQPCGCQNCPKSIPDNDTIQMPIKVQGAVKNDLSQPGQGVCRVCIRFDHDFVSDLEVKLISPAGQSITLVAPISQTGWTLNSKWNVCFVPCSQTAYPDPNKPPQWANASWGTNGGYTGSYYPYLGCLEDFNTGSVNGTWTLIVKDGDNIYDGTLLNWTIFFCDPTGLDCLTCAANGGDYSNIPAINTCKGDNSLNFNAIPIYTPNKPAPPPTYYSYTNVISKNGIIVGYQNPVNMQNFQAGDYSVCGFSYLTADAPKLPTPNGVATVNDLKNLTLGLKPQLCGNFSKGCIPVKIKAPSTPIFIDTISCKPFKYSTTVYTATGFYPEKLKAANGCDSLVYINLTYIPPVTKDSFKTICQGGFFQVGANKYNKTGIYKDTLISKTTGCDSILTLFLTVKNAPITNLNEAICEGDSFTIGLKKYFLTGKYKDTLQNKLGCDSIVNLDLKVKNKTFKILKISNCDNKPYVFNSKNYPISGIYKDTLQGQNQFKCDSIIMIDLTIYPTYKDTLDINICQGEQYKFGDSTFTKTGFHFKKFKNLNGQGLCDSLVWLKLLVTNVITRNIKANICQGDLYDFDAKKLNITGIYNAKNKSKSGCDSLTTLNLVVHQNPSLEKLTKKICEGDTLFIGKEKFFQTGKFTANLKTKYNCDSIVELDLTVKKPAFLLRTKSICEGECEKIGDSTYCKSGTYVNIFKKTNDCDSTVKLNLTINKKSRTELKPVLCESDTFFVGKNKKYYESGIYLDTLKNKNQCDSVIVTNLTITKSNKTNISNTLCFGKNIVINGKIYDKTGVFQDKSTSITTGCDSFLTINILVLPDYKTSVKRTICKGDTYLGQSNTGTYYVPLKTEKTNCDSLIQLILSVEDSIVNKLEYPICQGKTTQIGDSTYSKSGTYKNILKSKAGCDSIVYLNLTVASCDFDYNVNIANIGCGTNNEKGSIQLKIKPDYQGFINVSASQFGLILTSKKLNANETIDVLNLAEGKVIVRLENFWGTVKYDTFNIIKLPTLKGRFSKVSDYQGFGVRCPYNNDGFLSVSVSGGQAPYRFLWNNNYKDSVLIDLKAGNYKVTITDTLGCFVVLDTSLSEPPKPTLYFSHKDVTCFGYQNGQIQIDSISGGRAPFTYSIDLQGFSNQKKYENLKPELHLISVKDEFGCQIDTTKTLKEPAQIEINLGKDTTIALGETIFIQAYTNLSASQIDKINWNDFVVPTCTTCLSTTVQPTISTGYLLELTDKTGCKNFDVMTVFVRDSLPVYLPNTFSPNDDGINDYFTAFSNAKIQKIKRLSIYNRWGNLLFEVKDIPTNDPYKGWDGTYLNLPQAQDLYVYIIEIALSDETVKVLQGEIMLLR